MFDLEITIHEISLFQSSVDKKHIGVSLFLDDEMIGMMSLNSKIRMMKTYIESHEEFLNFHV
jgi:hypothetical protein